MTPPRLAATAALALTGGAATMLAALVAAPGHWWQGYVSEAGTIGQPHASAYRWGLIVLALGAGLGVVSAAVPCSGRRWPRSGSPTRARRPVGWPAARSR